MTIDEFYALRLNGIVYHKTEHTIIKLETTFVEGAERKPDNWIGGNCFNDGTYQGFPESDCEDWETYDLNAPVEVQLVMTQVELAELKMFVHSRLK